LNEEASDMLALGYQVFLFWTEKRANGTLHFNPLFTATANKKTEK
jgi:hypothetical protein